jgi:tRNA(Ile)-lysidine synthase
VPSAEPEARAGAAGGLSGAGTAEGPSGAPTERPVSDPSSASPPALGSAEHLGPEEIDRLFAPLATGAGLALAVSGGPDSTALMVAYAGFLARRPNAPRAIVLTVDHGLRAASAEEARAVAALAGRLGLAHRTLVWTGPKPAANLQAEARRARYALLAEAARAAGCDRIVTAHTLDDQAETVLLALARGSGVYGLAAMPAERVADGLVIARPFLAVPKARLVATLEEAGIPFATDPSNADERHARIRWRNAMARLASLGLTPERLAATAARMARAASAIDAAVETLFAGHATAHPGGFARIAAAPLLAAPDEVSLRALARLVRAVGGEAYPPRLERLERLLGALAAARPGAPLKRTLGGVVVLLSGDGLWFVAEAGRAGFPRLTLVPGETAFWHDRFRVSLDGRARAPVEVAALGRDGARRLPETGRRGLPALAVASVPAAFVQGTLAAVPGFDYVTEAVPEGAFAAEPVAAFGVAWRGPARTFGQVVPPG